LPGVREKEGLVVDRDARVRDFVEAMVTAGFTLVEGYRAKGGRYVGPAVRCSAGEVGRVSDAFRGRVYVDAEGGDGEVKTAVVFPS
jgi:flavin-dependent dehydrogenase